MILHYVLDFGYTKFENQFCNPKYGSYDTLQNAIEACGQNIECQFVNDQDCDDDLFKLCNIDATLSSSSKGSCIYQKPGNSKMLPISLIVTNLL